MIILGLNAYHADAAACILIDGKLVAAAEEERFRRLKHWAGFPSESIRYCLDCAGVTIDDVDHIAVNQKFRANLLRKLLFVLTQLPNPAAIKGRLINSRKILNLQSRIYSHLGVFPGHSKAVFHEIEHHRAHLASSFLVSPYESATLVSVDGFGDFVSTMWGEGRNRLVRITGQVCFPHSLGLFYLAITQHLGFPHYGDEYKVMGLAPYGKPSFMPEMRKLVRPVKNGRFALNLDYFLHHSRGISMNWEDCTPKIETVYTQELTELLGPSRLPDEPITQRHMDIAASMQEMYEDVFFHVLNHAYHTTRNPILCLAGGCAMNSVANGKIFERTPFTDVYIQSAAGDSGGAIGAAYYVWNILLNQSRSYRMDHAYLGPAFSNTAISDLLHHQSEALKQQNCTITQIADENQLCMTISSRIADGQVIGWFQGRMEWGPRALGNRSILCDPRRADMKDILNRKIKRRESFRPFAPSIIREAVGEWFETDYDVPFMLQVYPIRKEKQKTIPAVTHVNGSGRLQTVTETQNPRYYRLIRSFEDLTGVPILLNTSFNENEPVVCRPEEALSCFLRTRMDVLVMEDWVVERKDGRYSG